MALRNKWGGKEEDDNSCLMMRAGDTACVVHCYKREYNLMREDPHFPVVLLITQFLFL